MTNRKHENAEQGDSHIEDEKLDEATGGTGFFTECSGIGSEHESASQKTIIGGFKSVSGMDSETEVVEYRDGEDVLRKRSDQ